MRAKPADIFDAPTPKLRTSVGNSSAVKTGRIAFDWEIANLPIIARVIVTVSLKVSPKQKKNKY